MFKVVKKNNISWTVVNGLDDHLLENLYPRLNNFSASSKFSVVKNNNARTALFFRPEQSSSEQLFVKLYKKRKLGQKLKHILVPSQALSEWKKLRHFNKIGLASPKPLAFSEKRRFGLLDESCLIIEVIPSAIPLNQYFEKDDFKSGKKTRFILVLARFIRSLHDNNVFYKDLHSGNILVREKKEADVELFFIDLHQAALTVKLFEWMKVKDLAQLLNSVLFSKTEMLSFIKEYLKDVELESRNLADFFDKVTAKRNQLKKTTIKSRSKRCLKNSSVFSYRKNLRETYYGRRDFGKKEADRALSLHALNKKNSGTVLQNSRKSIITVVERDDKELLCVKENRFIGVFYLFKNLFRKSRAMRSWIAANGMLVRKIETPLPCAVIESKWGPFITNSFIITKYIKGSKEINDYINIFMNPSVKHEKNSFIKACALFLRNVHNAGVYHTDWKSNNLLVTKNLDNSWNFHLVDLDLVLFKKKLSFHQKVNNLSQLNASISSVMTVKERLKFFYFYARGTSLYNERKKYYRKVIAIGRAKLTEPYGITFA
jgi:tRNA A-37 threonylcarbamoyl transferase component Bud32